MSFGKKSFGKWTFGKKTFGKWTFGKKTFGKKTFRKKTFGKETFRKRTFGKRSVGKWTFGKKMFGKKTFGKSIKVWNYPLMLTEKFCLENWKFGKTAVRKAVPPYSLFFLTLPLDFTLTQCYYHQFRDNSGAKLRKTDCSSSRHGLRVFVGSHPPTNSLLPPCETSAYTFLTRNRPKRRMHIFQLPCVRLPWLVPPPLSSRARAA